MSVKYFPVDFDALNKGDFLDNEQLESILGVLQSHRLFKVKALALAARIEKEMRRRGKPATVTVERDGVLVNPDGKASKHNDRQFRLGARKLSRSHRRQMEVDIRQLEPDEAKRHERSLLVNGAVLQAVRSTRSRFALPCKQRQTPGLPAPAAT